MNQREMERKANARRACKECSKSMQGTNVNKGWASLHFSAQKNRIHRWDMDGEVKNYYHHRPWYKVYQHD